MEPMMQRKHYNAIAAALRSAGAGEELVHAVSRALEGTNPNFDGLRFRAKALEGETQEQRAAKYRTQLRRVWTSK